METLPITVIKKLEDGVLVPDGLVNKIREDEFLKNIKEGDKVSVMLEVVNIDATHAQNNYFHKLCRVISEDTGQPFEQVKHEVKIKAGLWKNKMETKSAADFSKGDMQAAIQAAIELGEDLGINLYSY